MQSCLGVRVENLCPKKTRSGKFGGKYGINWIYIENSGDFSYVFGGGIITVTNAKPSDESEKFTLKIRSESGKLFTNGCHFAPKSTNFGTLPFIHAQVQVNLTQT